MSAVAIELVPPVRRIGLRTKFYRKGLLEVRVWANGRVDLLRMRSKKETDFEVLHGFNPDEARALGQALIAGADEAGWD